MMKSTPNILLTPPVRILLRIAPDQLDQLNGTYQADARLIQMFSNTCNCDIAKVQHLVTRIGKRGLIMFDYDVPDDDYYPRMAAFHVDLTVNASLVNLSIEEFEAPRQYVNNLVHTWKNQNAILPRRTDLRMEQGSCGNAKS
jgi:hypothetical protein